MIRERNEGLHALLVDPHMKVRIAVPEEQRWFGPVAQEFALAALRSNQVVMSDLHRSQFNGAIHLDSAIPISECAAS